MPTLFALLACAGEAAPTPDSELFAVAHGEYYARAPEEGFEATLLWFHGHNTAAKGSFEHSAVQRVIDEHGFLVIVPVGLDESWTVRGSPGFEGGGRDELSFIEEVLDDAEERFGDLGFVASGGASHGASLPYQLACETDRVDLINPIMGTFWEPMPEQCPAPPKALRHVHGTSDSTWPFEEGRELGGSKQGDVPEALALWRRTLDCEEQSEPLEEEGISCERWACAEGEVRLCLHPGGHSKPSGWSDRLAAWVQERMGS